MKYKFQLYIADNKPGSVLARKRILSIFNQKETRELELEIIDIEQEPFRAEEQRIFAIPTLIKVSPLPIKKAIGDFNNTEKSRNWIDSCFI